MFWINMRNRGTIEASFHGIAQAFKLEIESSCSETAKGYLPSCNDYWLLILGNADDPDPKIT